MYDVGQRYQYNVFFVLCTDAQSLPCSVDSGGAGGVCPDVVCPGDVVMYTCTLPEVLGTTLLTLPDSYCTDSLIRLTQDMGGCSSDSGDCGPFTATNENTTGDCLVSTLTVTASLNINNSLIQCSNDPPGGSTDPVLVSSATLLVAG